MNKFADEDEQLEFTPDDDHPALPKPYTQDTVQEDFDDDE